MPPHPRRSLPAARPSSENGGSSTAPLPTAWRRQETACSPSRACRRANGAAYAPPTRSSVCTRNSNAGSRPKPFCRRPTPPRCCSGRCSHQDRSTCERWMAGRRSPQNPSISQLTLPPETIPSCYRTMRHTEFQPHSGRHLQQNSRTHAARSRSCARERHRCNTTENSRDTRADIRLLRRYINPARHVRAFGVGIGIGMTGSTRSSGGLDDRRKRLLFRCWHRGTREMDLILGRFADAEIANLADGELAELEYLMDVPDPDLYAALTGNVPPVPDFASGLFDRIKSFRSADRDA